MAGGQSVHSCRRNRVRERTEKDSARVAVVSTGEEASGGGFEWRQAKTIYGRDGRLHRELHAGKRFQRDSPCDAKRQRQLLPGRIAVEMLLAAKNITQWHTGGRAHCARRGYNKGEPEEKQEWLSVRCHRRASRAAIGPNPSPWCDHWRA
jgi:hypothetical protein